MRGRRAREKKNTIGPELYKEVPPYNSALELSDNVRETVRAFIAGKIPRLKERVPSLAELKDDAMLEALVDNWFEKASEEVEGQRREVLMAVMSHVVNRIELLSPRLRARGTMSREKNVW